MACLHLDEFRHRQMDTKIDLITTVVYIYNSTEMEFVSNTRAYNTKIDCMHV